MTIWKINYVLETKEVLDNDVHINTKQEKAWWWQGKRWRRLCCWLRECCWRQTLVLFGCGSACSCMKTCSSLCRADRCLQPMDSWSALKTWVFGKGYGPVLGCMSPFLSEGEFAGLEREEIPEYQSKHPLDRTLARFLIRWVVMGEKSLASSSVSRVHVWEMLPLSRRFADLCNFCLLVSTWMVGRGDCGLFPSDFEELLLLVMLILISLLVLAGSLNIDSQLLYPSTTAK